MTVISRIIGGLRALFRKKQVERELDDELRQYFDAAAAQNVATVQRQDH